MARFIADGHMNSGLVEHDWIVYVVYTPSDVPYQKPNQIAGLASEGLPTLPSGSQATIAVPLLVSNIAQQRTWMAELLRWLVAAQADSGQCCNSSAYSIHSKTAL